MVTKLATAARKCNAWKKAGNLSQSASCPGRERKSKSPFPLQPVRQTHEGMPVALLQLPAPHDFVSGAVIHASQAEVMLIATAAAELLVRRRNIETTAKSCGEVQFDGGEGSRPEAFIVSENLKDRVLVAKDRVCTTSLTQKSEEEGATCMYM